MAKFTIETTYDLPIYRHTTYEAETAEDAFAMAMADDDWSGQKEDIENGHDTRITGAWAGEEDYVGPCLPIPAEYSAGDTADAALPLGLSPLPWKYVNSSDRPVKCMADWIEDAHGNIVVENVGHIDGPYIVARANGGNSAEALRALMAERSNLIATKREQIGRLTAETTEAATALRYAYAAIESLIGQVQQMRGMFKDEDGAIQQAVDDGDAAIEDIGKALAKIA